MRKNTFSENGIINKFDFANRRAGELALKAKQDSNSEILIAGSIPTRGVTYQSHQDYDENTIYDEFYKTAKELDPFVNFYYLDVLCSIKEIITALNALKIFNKPTLIGMHFKKDFLLPSDESVHQVFNAVKNFNCEGLMTSCVSPEIYYGVLPFLKNQTLPFGFAVNAFIDIPEKIQLDEKFSAQPNHYLGLREELTPKKFSDFGVQAFKGGAKFLKGCCNIMPSHIESLSSSINNY